MKDTCANCKKPFKRKSYWQKFCSNVCRLNAWSAAQMKMVKKDKVAK